MSYVTYLNGYIYHMVHFDNLRNIFQRHAEVLVPDILPLGQVRGIFVRTQEMVQAVNFLIEESGLIGRIPDALRKTSLYF